MKYKCTHCSTIFSLEDHEFKRCPNCFWTTSLEPMREGADQSAPSVSSPPVQEKKKNRIGKVMALIFGGVILIAGAIYVVSNVKWPVQEHREKKESHASQKPVLVTNKVSSKEGSEAQVPSAVSADQILSPIEKAELMSRKTVTIPRTLSDSEEQTLDQQVKMPAAFSVPSDLPFWNLDDFDAMIKSAQNKWGVSLGWPYVSNLKDLFKEHYLKAQEQVQQGLYLEARDSLLNALVFPTYKNDIKKQRAVVHVMLRPFINDVIGKVSVLNKFLANQNLALETLQLAKTYETLIQTIALRNWDQALLIIQELKGKINVLNQTQGGAQVAFPPVFAQIDQDLQLALQQQILPSPQTGNAFEAVQNDLTAKEQVIRENTDMYLIELQKKYENAMRAIGEENWAAAFALLNEMQFPQEFEEHVAKKKELLQKLIAQTRV